MHNRSFFLVASLLLALSIFSSVIFAQAQNLQIQVPLQGVLKDSAAKPLTGNYDFKFEICEAASGNCQGESMLWSEAQNNVSVLKGKFQVYLGSATPLTTNLAKDKLLYLQISVRQPGETTYKTLNPRLKLSPTFAKVWKAKSAETADSVAAGGITGTISSNQIPNLDAGKITTGSFSTDRIPNLNANKITAGVFDVARIPSLDAGKITTGTFDIARMPTVDSKLSFKVSAGRNVVSDGGSIGFDSKSFGVSSFGTTPRVTCSTESYNYFCSIASVSTTGFTVRIIKSSDLSAGSTIVINWIAIGS